MATQPSFETLISVDELLSIIATDNVVIFDARFNLADAEVGRRAYQENHLPGAVYVHLDEQLSSPVTQTLGRHPMPDMQALAKWLSAAGLSSDKQVVVYDDMGGAMASRCWWLIKLLGHKNVAVLDGGFPAWVNAGHELDNTEPELGSDWLPPADLSVSVADQVVTTVQVETNLVDKQFILVDARTPERYCGEQEPIDPVAGHIPGAMNRPLPCNLENGFFKSASVLHSEWSELLQGRDVDSVVHMCGSGVTACHNLLAMEYAGLTGSKVYAGSWSEWIRDPDHPIATTK